MDFVLLKDSLHWCILKFSTCLPYKSFCCCLLQRPVTLGHKLACVRMLMAVSSLVANTINSLSTGKGWVK